MYRLLSLAAVLALAACSSAAPTAATTPTPSAAVITADPTPSATATATATPTPTVWTKTEAAAQYLALVKPSNDARVAVSAYATAHPKDAKGVAPLCQSLATELKGFLDALAVGRWPADARSAVDDVMASVGAQMNAAQGCARGKTIADFNAAWDYTDPHPGAAQVLRAKLGLPAAG